MTVYLIRHAESVSNAGERTASHGGAELSSEGRRQAEALTARIGFCPDLIVVSPFVRTRQTAEPLRQKYPDVPVEEWPVQEFSFLDADRCADKSAGRWRKFILPATIPTMSTAKTRNRSISCWRGSMTC